VEGQRRAPRPHGDRCRCSATHRHWVRRFAPGGGAFCRPVLSCPSVLSFLLQDVPSPIPSFLPPEANRERMPASGYAASCSGQARARAANGSESDDTAAATPCDARYIKSGERWENILRCRTMPVAPRDCRDQAANIAAAAAAPVAPACRRRKMCVCARKGRRVERCVHGIAVYVAPRLHEIGVPGRYVVRPQTSQQSVRNTARWRERPRAWGMPKRGNKRRGLMRIRPEPRKTGSPCVGVVQAEWKLRRSRRTMLGRLRTTAAARRCGVVRRRTARRQVG